MSATRTTTATPVLSVQGLNVHIGRRHIVQDVSFTVEPGKTLGLVGESGSGKSMTVLAATGLLDAPGARVRGSSLLGEAQLVGAGAARLRRVHGSQIGFVFQDPSTSLNPLLTVERQITESLEAHSAMSRGRAISRAGELIEAVGLPDPGTKLRSYPHQLSGGQRQRVMIAIALACDPQLLIADEPTTALDVTTQKQVVELVQALQQRTGTAVVWISHDLGVIGRVADDVTVLREGRVVEQAPARQLYAEPRTDYTRELLAARPALGKKRPAPPGDGVPVLTVNHLSVTFRAPRGRTITAVDDVSFTVRRGQTLGLVGQSGSGKSTIANALTGLVPAAAGTATLHHDPGAGRASRDVDLLHVPWLRRRDIRRRVAMVFQDPFASLDPRSRVSGIIDEPLRVHRLAGGPDGRRARVKELLDLVGLGDEYADRHPHELSGGQRQRVSIARALALDPAVLILDESTSALDVSIQARVLDLLADLQRDLGLTYLFIAHDLAVVEQMCHDVLVLRDGRTQEYRPGADLFAEPESAYTNELLAAVPPAEPKSVRPDW
ncbi:MAG TPA: ABC transporter ATP-binding protein [Propionibacterium sp.]|nr:ABC transporter ATP-binding protein [Propionibacterium sp.]